MDIHRLRLLMCTLRINLFKELLTESNPNRKWMDSDSSSGFSDSQDSTGYYNRSLHPHEKADLIYVKNQSTFQGFIFGLSSSLKLKLNIQLSHGRILGCSFRCLRICFFHHLFLHHLFLHHLFLHNFEET